MKKGSIEPSRHEIWKMFDQISSTYDRINCIMTLGRDSRWRKKMAHFLPESHSISLLDCATGTGDQIFSLLKHSQKITEAIGIDLSKEMLALAEKKAEKIRQKPPVSFVEASLLTLPFASERFDCVTISFGIRNVTDVLLALKEAFRVLKPQGRLLILEGSLPKHAWLKTCALFYLRHLLPRIGGYLSKNPSAYRYLNQTIETFPCGANFCALMAKAGFTKAFFKPLMGGVATIYVGSKE